MGSRRLFLLCVALSVTHTVLGEVWEFGVDAPGSIIIDQKEGDFSLFQKTKEIQLTVPHCYMMEYVRVQVRNSISSPTVKYNHFANIVTIAYKPLQFSVSRYNIVAKAARKPGCYNHAMEMQMRHKFGKLGSR